MKAHYTIHYVYIIGVVPSHKYVMTVSISMSCPTSFKIAINLALQWYWNYFILIAQCRHLITASDLPMDHWYRDEIREVFRWLNMYINNTFYINLDSGLYRIFYVKLDIGIYGILFVYSPFLYIFEIQH